MKRKFGILVALFVVLPIVFSGAQTRQKATRARFAATPKAMATASTVYTSILFSWGYPYTTPPACTTNGVLENCVAGFTLTDETTGTVLATPATLPVGTTSWTWTPSGGLYFGTHAFALVTTGYDAQGGVISSTAVTVSVANNLTTLNPPVGLTGTPQ